MVISTLSPLVATEAARLARVPVVHWLQNPFSRVTPFDGPSAGNRLNRIVLAHVAKHSAALAGASPGTVQELSGTVPSETVMEVVPNAVELPELAAPDPDGPARIVSIGRLAAQKRHDVLLDAFARIAGDWDTRLVIFGNGPLKARLESQAEALGVGDLVAFEGFVETPAARLRANDVFALCSDFEGFGNVFVEALSTGVRIVAADAPYGARFVLEGVANARLVPPGSSVSMAAALSAALASGSPTDTDRVEARVRAERFTVERVAERMEALLDDVLR